MQVNEINNKTSRKDERRELREQRAALERDVSIFLHFGLTNRNCFGIFLVYWAAINVSSDYLMWHDQVFQLQKQLIIELDMRNALNRGLSRPLGSLPRIYASLPVEVWRSSLVFDGLQPKWRWIRCQCETCNLLWSATFKELNINQLIFCNSLRWIFDAWVSRVIDFKLMHVGVWKGVPLKECVMRDD